MRINTGLTLSFNPPRGWRASPPKRAAGKSWAILGTSPEWFDQNFINLVSLFDGTGFLDFVKKKRLVKCPLYFSRFFVFPLRVSPARQC
jgi:hypothetical protein